MKKLMSSLLVGSLVVSTTFAGLEQIPVATEVTTVEKVGSMSEVVGYNGIKYSYDEAALKKIYDQKSSLIEVVCQSEEVFKNLGVDSKTIKINSIGFSKQELDIMVDAKNCSFYANRTNRNQTNNGTNDKKALESAQKFIDEVFGEKGVVSLPKLGKPEITRRDNGGMATPMVKEATLDTGSSLSSVELVKSDKSDEKVEVKYNSINILFPYVVGDTPIYANYGGGKLGVVVTVDGNGVMSVSVPLLAFKGVAKTADKNTLAGLKRFVAQGGNQPYRGSNGNSTTVKFNKPERVLVYFQYYAPTGTPRNFISDGIKLSSDLKQDQWSQLNYEMIISDFVIGNNNNPVLLDASEVPAVDTTMVPASTESNATMSTGSSSEKPKTTIKRKLKLKKKTVM